MEKTEGGLSPLQLALASAMATGFTNPYKDSPLFVNKQFLAAMAKFADSGLLTATDIGYRSDFANLPPIAPGITGISYIIEPDEEGKIAVYLLRRAPDCGPNENRFEKIKLGLQSELAEGSFAYWGSLIRGGSIFNGAGGPWGTGGLSGSYPGPAGSPNNPNTDLSDLGSFLASELNSATGAPPDPSLIGNYAGRGGIC